MLEEVYWRRCVTGSGLRGFKSPGLAQCLPLYLLTLNYDVNSQALIQNHACLLPMKMILDEPSETVSKPHNEILPLHVYLGVCL